MIRHLIPNSCVLEGENSPFVLHKLFWQGLIVNKQRWKFNTYYKIIDNKKKSVVFAIRTNEKC
jgi:hypothetical protein